MFYHLNFDTTFIYILNGYTHYVTRMHSSRMRTARSLPYLWGSLSGGLPGQRPWTETPRTETPRTETPPDRDPPGQRPPRTETPPDRDPPDRDPMDRNPQTEGTWDQAAR